MFIDVPCVSPDAEGMSIWQWNATLDHMGENAVGAGVNAVRKARSELRDMAQGTLSGRKTSVKTRGQAARLLATAVTQDKPPLAIAGNGNGSAPAQPKFAGNTRTKSGMASQNPAATDADDIAAYAAAAGMISRKGIRK